MTSHTFLKKYKPKPFWRDLTELFRESQNVHRLKVIRNTQRGDPFTLFHPSFFARAKRHTLFGPFLNKRKRGTELRPEYSTLKTRVRGKVYKSPSRGLIVLHPPSKQGEFSKVRRVTSSATELPPLKTSPQFKSPGRKNDGKLLRGSSRKKTDPEEPGSRCLWHEDYIKEWH